MLENRSISFWYEERSLKRRLIGFLNRPDSKFECSSIKCFDSGPQTLTARMLEKRKRSSSGLIQTRRWAGVVSTVGQGSHTRRKSRREVFTEDALQQTNAYNEIRALFWNSKHSSRLFLEEVLLRSKFKVWNSNFDLWRHTSLGDSNWGGAQT